MERLSNSGRWNLGIRKFRNQWFGQPAACCYYILRRDCRFDRLISKSRYKKLSLIMNPDIIIFLFHKTHMRRHITRAYLVQKAKWEAQQELYSTNCSSKLIWLRLGQAYSTLLIYFYATLFGKVGQYFDCSCRLKHHAYDPPKNIDTNSIIV